MEAFFSRILHGVIMSIITGKDDATPEEAQAAIKGFIAEAVKEGTQDVSLALDNMDGKVGNLQEQMEAAPGHIISGVIDGVVGSIQKIIQNPLGGIFGPR